MLPDSHRFLGSRNLFQSPAKVYGSGSSTFGGLPGNRVAQCIVDFEHSRSVLPAIEASSKALGKTTSCNLYQLSWSQIEHRDVSLRQIVDILYFVPSLDDPSKALEVTAKCVRD